MMSGWQKILDILQKTVNKGIFKVWVKPLQAELKGQNLALYAPNDFVASWVRDRLLSSISEAAEAALGFAPEISVQTGRINKEEATCPAPKKEADARSGFEKTATQLGLPIDPHPNLQAPRLRWRFSFDDFVVGPSNELAHAAAKGLSNDTLQSEQLFLSSGPGLGKTHLIQAIGHQLGTLCNRANPRVEYLTSEEFATQLVLAIKGNSLDRFKARFRDNVDLLLMEDIHFFQGKQKMQDELLATIRALRSKGARVVFTSSFLPRELKDVDEQLASRFCSGLLTVIDKPDLETRRRIVQAKARTQFQVPLADSVAELLADRIRSDVRQLESCLHNLVLKARLLNRAITLDLAAQVVGDYADEDLVYDIATIIDFVCRSYDLNIKQLQSKSRKRQVVIARNTAFFLARQHTELSLKDIGRHFNRQHSTVLKGITNVEREINLETPTGRQLSRTMDMLGNFKFYR